MINLINLILTLILGGGVPRWVVGAVCGHYETYKTGLKRWVAFKEWRKKMEWTEDADMTITLKSSMT